MHRSSYIKVEALVDAYLRRFATLPLQILDVGSRIAEEGQLAYRPLFDKPPWTYRGMDVEPGANVEIAVANPYDWTEIASGQFDVVVSGQTFEHIEYFWVTIHEIVRTLKENGVAIIVAPGGGFEHRYPVDCYRFYRDGMSALAKYSSSNVLEAFTQWESWGHPDKSDVWQDCCLVLQKPVLSKPMAESLAIKNALLKMTLQEQVKRSDLASLAVPEYNHERSALPVLEPLAVLDQINEQRRQPKKRSLRKRIKRYLRGNKKKEPKRNR